MNRICIVGAGGLGSVLAENLIHMGFDNLILIDPDRADTTNPNRMAGLTQANALSGVPKVQVVKRHLKSIAPHAHVHGLCCRVEDERLLPYLATARWVIIGTDNHSSRAYAQAQCLKYFTPMMSLGVNISVNEETITDMSGEVIIVRPGDDICLHCLGRLNPIKIAAESHPDAHIRTQMIEKGYVTGADVAEPAIKTLNAIVASVACDQLVNAYTERQAHRPILVYENNKQPLFYEDTESVRQTGSGCYSCAVAERTRMA